MVASSITIDAVYLDGRVKSILANAVRMLEDGTEVKTSDNGLLEVNERWEHVKRSWNLSWSTASGFIENLFEVNRQSRGFLFISPLEDDRDTTGQAIDTGDGAETEFQLQITKTNGVHSVSRDIQYPLASTVIMYVNAVAKTPGVDFTFSTTTGVVTFAVAPPNGHAITADFSYAWPVHFSSNTISTTLLQTDHKEVRSVQIEEIF